MSVPVPKDEIPDDDGADGTRQGAPLIHISHLHAARATPGGVVNDAFLADDDLDEGSMYSLSRPVSPESIVHPRRNSYNITGVSPRNTGLNVPDNDRVRRRHSVGNDIIIEAPPPPEDPDMDVSLDLWNEVTGQGVPMTTLGVDHLIAPQTQKSPGCRSARSMRSDWTELARLERSDSIDSFQSLESVHSTGVVETGGETSFSGISSQMSVRIKNLIRKFNSRTERFKEKAIQPPTPSSTSSLARSEAISVMSKDELEPPTARQHRLDSFIPISRASGADNLLQDRYIGYGRCKIKVPQFLNRIRLPTTLDPTNKVYISWLFFVTLAYMYNAASIPLRAAFYTSRYYFPGIEYKNITMEKCDNVTFVCSNLTELMPTYVTRYYSGYQTADNLVYWWILDYLADLFYIVDVLLVKNRVRFVNNGLLEKDWKTCLKHYTAKREFKLDLIALTPLDLLYFIPQIKYNSLVRFPRLIKIKTFWEFYDRLDQMVSSAHILRIVRTLTYMLFLIHLEACGYYLVSAYEGLGKNEWVYSGNGIAYIRCIYLATKTATSIGNNPKPTNKLEYVFMTVYWLSGVFVFAMLIGQIRDIFQAAGLAQENYRKTMDQTLSYMKSLNLPKDIQKRVRTWFNYNWENSKTLDENSLLEGLPKKMKADLAIHVHFKTLSKVQLFQDCDKNLLFDLVLKLQPCLYLPGDYICRKGEVGVEMYIVMSGQVEVVGGENNSVVFATLHEGSVFGEISLLALAGGNRRTADVRSKGFSQLFILSKNDFEEAMREYPAAAKILRRRAKRLLAQNAKHTKKSDDMEGEEVIQSRQGTPKLIKTVIQVVDPKSHIHDYLKSSQTQMKDGRRPSSAISGTGSKMSLDPQLHNEELVDDILDDDEMLVVEQIERRLTPQELHELQQENNPSLWPPSPQTGELPDARPTSSATINSGIVSILDTPTKVRDPVLSLHNLINNKVAPASITYEDDEHGTPTKPAIKTSKQSVTSNANGAIMGGKDAKMAMGMLATSASRSGGAMRMRTNKIAPLVADGDDDKNADGNTVTCQVEVHRCKTKSPPMDVVSATRVESGVVNMAFISQEALGNTDDCVTVDGETEV